MHQTAPIPPNQNSPDYPAGIYLLYVLQSLLPTNSAGKPYAPVDMEGNSIDLIPLSIASFIELKYQPFPLEIFMLFHIQFFNSNTILNISQNMLLIACFSLIHNIAKLFIFCFWSNRLYYCKQLFANATLFICIRYSMIMQFKVLIFYLNQSVLF